ncbi:hypothetical protein FOQG_16188 [Fusarium oxysporum f. sp. raphani 54005]|uniref:Uncharacterized protein n=1 Tax=Fusarium oxysporum f. sp. raphani 54005 TaxID=1089458 RepID=X0BL56_FUSOX|nr:hypothetical protein FOQG_16188 [Fusarium oxysporum f. sp. raphani 54005]
MAMEIGIDWGKEDNAGRVRLAIFEASLIWRRPSPDEDQAGHGLGPRERD